MAAVTIWPAPSRIAHFRVTTGISSSTHKILAIYQGPLAGTPAASRKSKACNHYIVCVGIRDFDGGDGGTLAEKRSMDGISGTSAAPGLQSGAAVGAFQQFFQNLDHFFRLNRLFQVPIRNRFRGRNRTDLLAASHPN